MEHLKCILSIFFCQELFIADSTQFDHRVCKPIWLSCVLLLLRDYCRLLGVLSGLLCRQRHSNLLPVDLVHREVLIVPDCAINSYIAGHAHILGALGNILMEVILIFKTSTTSIVAPSVVVASASRALQVSELVLVLRIKDLKHRICSFWGTL